VPLPVARPFSRQGTLSPTLAVIAVIGVQRVRGGHGADKIAGVRCGDKTCARIVCIVTQILAISGSLRHQSTNARLLQTAERLLPPDTRIVYFTGLGELPHFNPDLDADEPPPLVRELRELVGAADALVISSPEYAHGVPGSLKNALDWLVASAEIVGKPVALINASSRAQHAYASLAETLRTMSARIIAAASPVVARDARKHLDVDALVREPEVAEPLRLAMAELVRACAAPAEADGGAPMT
jgi:chromate reductase